MAKFRKSNDFFSIASLDLQVQTRHVCHAWCDTCPSSTGSAGILSSCLTTISRALAAELPVWVTRGVRLCTADVTSLAAARHRQCLHAVHAAGCGCSSYCWGVRASLHHDPLHSMEDVITALQIGSYLSITALTGQSPISKNKARKSQWPMQPHSNMLKKVFILPGKWKKC